MNKNEIMDKISRIENSINELNNEKNSLNDQIKELEKRQENLLIAKIIELAKIENVKFQELDRTDYDYYEMIEIDKNIDISYIDSVYVSIEDIIKYIL